MATFTAEKQKKRMESRQKEYELIRYEFLQLSRLSRGIEFLNLESKYFFLSKNV